MPVWGETFKAAGTTSSQTGESAVRGTAQEIVSYIETIQEK
jgi:hypothetical protein